MISIEECCFLAWITLCCVTHQYGIHTGLKHFSLNSSRTIEYFSKIGISCGKPLDRLDTISASHSLHLELTQVTKGANSYKTVQQ